MKIFIASAPRKAATMGLAAVTLAASIGAVCAEPARLSRDEQFYGTSAAPIRKLSSHAGFALVSIVPGRAADLAASPGPDFAGETAATPSGWTFTVAPYLFAAGLSGQVAQFGAPPVNVSLDFGDILNHLKFGAMAVSRD